MLAQVFKTPDQLGIAEDLRDGFIELLRLLESGELKYVNLEEEYKKIHELGLEHEDKAPDAKLFNMMDWSVELPTCGSVCCLGGSVERIMGRALDSYEDGYLNDLFYPRMIETEWNNISAEKAAGVLRHYLTTGIIDWAC